MQNNKKIIPPIPYRENFGGLLRKRKNSNFQRIFGDTNTRYFFIQYDNEVFGYKNNETDKKTKAFHKFSEFISVKELFDKSSKSNTKEWKYGIEIELSRKKYLIFAQNEDTKNKWIKEFKIILRLLPEAFPLMSKKVFKFALDFFQRPYLDSIKKEKEHKEFLRKKEKEDIINKKKEEILQKEKLENLQKLEKEKLLKKEQEEILLKKKTEEEEILLKKKIEEENLRKEEEIKKKELLDRVLKNKNININHNSSISISLKEGNEQEEQIDNYKFEEISYSDNDIEM